MDLECTGVTHSLTIHRIPRPDGPWWLSGYDNQAAESIFVPPGVTVPSAGNCSFAQPSPRKWDSAREPLPQPEGFPTIASREPFDWLREHESIGGVCVVSTEGSRFLDGGYGRPFAPDALQAPTLPVT
jgi:hypothetical protein